MNELNRERLRQILDEPAFTEAVTELEKDLFEDWNEDGPNGPDAMERDQIYHTKKALTRLIGKMRNLAHSG